MPPQTTQPAPKNGRRSIDATVKSICDIMRRGNMSGALQYVPELSRLLFLRILDETEESEQRKIEAVGKKFSPSLPRLFAGVIGRQKTGNTADN